MKDQYFIGVDIAKAKFDAAILCPNGTQQHKVFANTQSGFKQFLHWSKASERSLSVCLEATGHYSEPLAEFLCERGVKTHVENPLKVKRYIQSTLSRTKNDKADAIAIAQYASRHELALFQPRSKQRKQLRERVRILNILIEHKAAFKQQESFVQIKTSLTLCRKQQRLLETQIDALMKKIASLIQAEQELKQQVDWLTSIEGIGKQTAYTLLAYLPPIERFEAPKQLASFCGLTPRERQSGEFKGQTCISKLGDSRIRKSLYMPALSAFNRSQGLKPFVRRLRANGKNNKAIVIAIMRKLLHIVFGVLKNKTFYDPQLASKAN